MKTRLLLSAALLAAPLLAPIPAIAQDADPAVATDAPVKADAGKALGDMLGAMIKVDDTPVDPARLALARVTAGKLVPEGVYARMMKGTFDKMLTPLFEGMMKLPAADLATMGGIDESSADAALGNSSVGDAIEKTDPDAAERMAIMTRIMGEEFTRLMSDVEPAVREAFARIYARKYDAAQLKQLNAFFGTPTGTAFAGDFLTSFTDPEMLQASMAMVPKMFEVMPRIQDRMKAETAHLPPLPEPPRFDDGDGADAAALNEAGETGEEPWFNSENWIGREKRAYDRASAAMIDAIEASNAAENAAIDAARERYMAAGWKPGMAQQPRDAAEDAFTED